VIGDRVPVASCLGERYRRCSCLWDLVAAEGAETKD
jgi:hypothetical protein